MGLRQSKSNQERAPELREFVKEHDQRLYDFCFYLCPRSLSAQDVLLETFREFGDVYRKRRKAENTWDPIDCKLQLFALAWSKIRGASHVPHWQEALGGDARALKAMETSLLAAPQFDAEAFSGRLRLVDVDCRAALLLRDYLGFSDDECLKVLGLRWGVYRHRLHRGRLELRDLLRGRLSGSGAEPGGRA